MAVVGVLRALPVPERQHLKTDKLPSITVKVIPKPSLPNSNMPSPPEVTQETQRGIKRTRKSHNKVRTGCLTCKIRKKKCDETKPACTRCTSTGRKCDGYAVPDALPTTPSQGSRESATPAIYSPESGGLCHNDNSNEPRVFEIHDNDNEKIGSLLDTDGNADETEVTDFILSYASNTPTDESRSSSPHPRSTSTSTSTSTQLTPFSRSQSPSIHKTSRSPNSPLPRSPNFFPPTTEISTIDSSCFSYFRHVTGPSIASYFDSSLWRTYATSAALAHPVVFAAATAVGAVHQRFNHGISREAFEYCGHAARLHARAIRQLEDLKSQNVNRGLIGSNDRGGQGMGVYDRDVIMTCEMLLSLFEGFQQNYVQSVAHINNSMKYLLSRPMTLMHSETRYCAVDSSKTNVFRQFFEQLKRRAGHLFDSEIRILVHWGDGLPLPKIPDVFSTLDEARDYLFTEVDWIMHAPSEAWSDTKERKEAQSLHVGRLMKWSVSYAETNKIMARTPRQKVACKLMKLTRNVTHLLLFMTLFAPVDFDLPRADSPNDNDDDNKQSHGMNDIAWSVKTPGNNTQRAGLFHNATQALFDMIQHHDFFATQLARLKVLAESILDSHSLFQYEEHSVSFDSAVGPPQRNDAMPDSSNKTRHLVKTFLKNSCESSSLWEMLGVYGVAEKVSAVEEHAVIAAVRDIIPEHMDPRWVDITCLMESRKILLRYCRPDERGWGMVWTQEWWAF